MSNQKPDGWVQPKWAEDIADGRDVEIRHAARSYAPWIPICLISPQELSRLRLIEDLVKCAKDEFESSRRKNNEDIWDILQDVLQGYDALTEANP